MFNRRSHDLKKVKNAKKSTYKSKRKRQQKKRYEYAKKYEVCTKRRFFMIQFRFNSLKRP